MILSCMLYVIILDLLFGKCLMRFDMLQDSPMRVPAEQFLTWRAFGAPPIVIALAAQGTFRGFKDTKTPLYAIGKLQHASLSLSLSFYMCVCVCMVHIVSVHLDLYSF